MHGPPAGLATVRGLAWQYLHEAWAPRLGNEGWSQLVSTCGAPEPGRVDPLASYPLAPFQQSLLFLDRRLGAGDGAVAREAGRALAESWARTYRHLARRLQGDPAGLLGVLCAEVLPWLHDDPGAARLVDAGPLAALVELRPGLPAPFQEGLLEGAAAAAGVPGARVAREGPRLAVTWEGAAARAARPPAPVLLARALRLPYLLAALVPVLVGAALAWADGPLRWDYLALTALGVGLFQLGANASNEYFDRRADALNATPSGLAGGSRVLPRGLLRPRTVLALAAALYALGAAVGLHLAFALQADHGAGLGELLVLGVLGFLAGVLYTAPPVALARRGLGELAVGLGFGPLLVAGTYLVQRAAAGAGAVVSAEALLFSLPVGALVAAVLYIHEFPDRPWDAQAGKRTLVVRLGPRAAVAGFGALLALAYGGIAALAALTQTWPALLALLTAPLAWKAWGILRRSHAMPFQLAPAGAATMLLHVATGLLLSGGIALARVLGRGA